MMDSPLQYVIDTNILIDFGWGGLVEVLFALPYLFLAPDLIIAELGEPDESAVLALGLQSVALSAFQVGEVDTLSDLHPGVSPNDLSALLLARDRALPLLTGDRNLRRLAQAEGVTVHGTLWLLDDLVRLGLVLPERAAAALVAMLAHGSRLPDMECQRRLQDWCQ